MTRLPTERLATACWDFIVAKRTPPEPAPVLVFGPLRTSNRESYQQLVNSLLQPVEGCRDRQICAIQSTVKAERSRKILALEWANRTPEQIEVKGHSLFDAIRRTDCRWPGNCPLSPDGKTRQIARLVGLLRTCTGPGRARVRLDC